MSKLSDYSEIPKAVVSRLQKLGINSLSQLIFHFPLRYLDETKIIRISDLRLGETAQVQAEVKLAEVIYKPRRTLLVKLSDGSGELYIRLLNFYPSQLQQLQAGTVFRILGEVRAGFFGYEMVHPQIRKASETAPVKTTLTPIYPTTAGLSQYTLAKWVDWALAQADLSEFFPANCYPTGMMSFAESMRLIHHPAQSIDLHQLESRQHPAWQRLAYDELLAQQLSMRRHYLSRHRLRAPNIQSDGALIRRFLDGLPFQLTDGQNKVIQEIHGDLNKAFPMNRLLQGDVGSGKTVVATIAALQAIASGYQVALMAPTEILAEQHFKKIAAWFESLGLSCVWLSGSQTKKQKQQHYEFISSGQAHLAIGTHALIQQQVSFAKLGLVIVDEQHRFGVEQRLMLKQKANTDEWIPHQLMMTATPIPRTLSMSYFADLDVSVIDGLPPGRTPIQTKLVNEERRDEVVQLIEKVCQAGTQVYWVCPLIEESEALQLKTALETFERLSADFPNLKVGLVHGKLKAAEKQQVMQAFYANEIQVLVSTTVIEVGVDVPNASIMVIEHAERMGLSQLHQLRGRVGRGSHKSTCILLFQTPLSQMARARLRVVYENTDGFKIAEEDLRLRGPGEFLGTRQSGLPMLKVADLERDKPVLRLAQQQADQILRQHPQGAQRQILRWLGTLQDLATV